MAYSISKKFLTATSALLLLSMSSLPVIADVISPLSEEHGLSEAAKQYLLHYPSHSGVDGKTVREDTAAIFIPFGAPRKADGQWLSGPTAPLALLITVRLR